MVQAADRLVGLLDQAGLDPLGSSQSFLPRRKHERPHAKYGKRGIYVLLVPIDGLTPAGVFKDDKPFAFQCPPMNQFGEDGTHAFNDYGVIGKEQHSERVGKQLRTVQFETLFMESEPEFALAHDGSGVYPAQQAVKDLCGIRDSGAAFHLLVHQSNYQDKYEVDYAATLRSVSWNMQEPDAYYVTVGFTEFSTPDIQEFLVGAAQHPHLPTSLAVKNLPSNRNTLAKMAKFYYGDPHKWTTIAATNGLTQVAANRVIGTSVTRRTRITIPAVRETRRARGQHR